MATAEHLKEGLGPQMSADPIARKLFGFIRGFDHAVAVAYKQKRSREPNDYPELLGEYYSGVKRAMQLWADEEKRRGGPPAGNLGGSTTRLARVIARGMLKNTLDRAKRGNHGTK